MGLEIYPFATADGKAIPLEALYPQASILLSVTQEAMGAAKDLNPGKTDVVFAAFCVGSPVVIKAGATPIAAYTMDTLETDSVILMPNTHYLIYLPSNQLSAIGLNGSAELVLNIIKSWKALAIPSQFNNY